MPYDPEVERFLEKMIAADPRRWCRATVSVGLLSGHPVEGLAEFLDEIERRIRVLFPHTRIIGVVRPGGDLPRRK
ncbi:MAG TPA: hypothetical protein VF407_02240 [Polyangiaceae bacterium]